MLFSVITPSFNQLDWLRLCIRSVADQAAEKREEGRLKAEIISGLEIEHIVQDGGTAGLKGSSADEYISSFTLPISRFHSLSVFTEPDSGMYDAINRGFRRATGDICAYLNCDEQYLPGALDAVARYFTAHPDVDVVFADAVVVDENGGYLCSRLAQTPFRDQLWFRMPVLSCATFIRRSAIERHGLYLDATRKIAADVFWVMAMQKAGLKMRTLRTFTSVFTETSQNLGVGGKADEEFLDIQRMMPAHVKRLLPLYLLYHRVRSVCAGVYFQKPFSYALFTQANPDLRVTHQVDQPTQVWKSRLHIDREALAAQSKGAKVQT